MSLTGLEVDGWEVFNHRGRLGKPVENQLADWMKREKYQQTILYPAAFSHDRSVVVVLQGIIDVLAVDISIRVPIMYQLGFGMMTNVLKTKKTPFMRCIDN